MRLSRPARRCVLLVLSRKRDEGIVIRVGGHELHFIVVEIRRDKVRLGFRTQDGVEFIRDEILAAGPWRGPVPHSESSNGQPRSPEGPKLAG